jgi:HKD family nuclease
MACHQHLGLLVVQGEVTMRVLTTAAQVSEQLIHLLQECSSCQVAVAWASVGFDAFEELKKNSGKIVRMVVGTHFWQTHPDFIEAFLENACVRFVRSPGGIFHPKVYLFESPGGAWACLLGSPNFTAAGMSTNDEMAVLMTNADHGAQTAHDALVASFESYWRKADSVGRAELEAYRTAWKPKQPALQSLRESFGGPAILFSADPKLVDMADAIQHLHTHDNLYFEVKFPIKKEAFSFPLAGFVHISGDQVRYAARIEDILPFSTDHYDNPQLAPNVKPTQWLRDWQQNTNAIRSDLWKHALVITEIIPFNYDTKQLLRKKDGKPVKHPPQKYTKVLPPAEWAGFSNRRASRFEQSSS